MMEWLYPIMLLVGLVTGAALACAYYGPRLVNLRVELSGVRAGLGTKLRFAEQRQERLEQDLAFYKKHLRGYEQLVRQHLGASFEDPPKPPSDETTLN